jgi:hypothetical protein
VAITPAVTVRLQDQFGNSVATSGVNVSLSSSSGSLTATSPVATNTSGIATFSDVTYAGTVLGTALTATSSGLTSTTSSSFDVTVNVTSAANSLAISASDAGSGVKSVSYYYCSGLSGACTSGTLIGTSTSGGSFPINWASRPATGPYRVVAVATDKVGNTSAVSGSTPVTVSS